MIYPIKISYIPNSVVFRQNDLTAELLDVLTKDIENMGWTEIISKSKLSPSEASFLEDHNNRDMVLDTLNKRCQNVWTLRIPNWFSFNFGDVNSTDEDEKTVLTVPVRIDLLAVYRSL